MIAEPRKNIEKPEALDESLDLKKKATRERADLSLELKEKEEEFPADKLEKAKRAFEKLKKGKKPEEFEWMPTLVKAGLFAGGAYMGYQLVNKIWSKFDEKASEEEKKLLTAPMILTAAATAVGVGYLIKKDEIPDFFKNFLDIEAKKESISIFLEKLKDGDVAGAFDFLSIDSNTPYIVNSAKKLDIEKKYILNLRDVKYSEFLKHKSSLYKGKLSYATLKAMEVAGLDINKNIPFTKTDDELRKMSAEEKIAEYIDENKDGFSDIEGKTIGEILLALNTEETPIENKSVKEVVEDKKAEVLNDVKEFEKSSSKVAKEISTWANNDSSVAEKAGDLVDAAKEDGSELFTYDRALFLYKNGSVFLISSLAFFGDTVMDVSEAAVSEDKTAGSVVTSFIERGGMGYVGTGAALGALYAGLQKAGFFAGEGNILRSAASGAMKGLIAPYNIFKATTLATKSTYLAGEAAYDRIKHLSFSGRQLLDPANKVLYEQARAIEYAEQYLKTFHEINAVEGGASALSREGIIAKAKETILPGKTMALRDKYAKWFFRSRREMLKLSGAADDFKFDLRNIDGEAAEMAEEAEKFLAEHKTPGFASALSRAKRGIDVMAEETEVIKKISAVKDQARMSDDLLKSSIIERAEMARAGKTALEISVFDDEVRALLKESSDKANDLLRGIDISTLSKAEKAALKELLTKDLKTSLGMRALVKNMKFRSGVGIVLGSAYYVAEKYVLSEEEKGQEIENELNEAAGQIGWEALELVVDVAAPFGITDWYAVVKGKGIVTGREYSGWERASRAVFGTYSLVADSLAVAAAVGTAPAAGTGGAVVYGAENAIEAAVRVALKGAGKGPDVIEAAKKLIPRITEWAHDLGGYKELLLKIQNVARKGAYAVVGAQVASVGLTFAGYDIGFDTSGQEPMEFDPELLADLNEGEIEKKAA